MTNDMLKYFEDNELIEELRTRGAIIEVISNVSIDNAATEQYDWRPMVDAQSFNGMVRCDGFADNIIRTEQPPGKDGRTCVSYSILVLKKEEANGLRNGL
jgi:hypothetical protein